MNGFCTSKGKHDHGFGLISIWLRGPYGWGLELVLGMSRVCVLCYRFGDILRSVAPCIWSPSPRSGMTRRSVTLSTTRSRVNNNWLA